MIKKTAKKIIAKDASGTKKNCKVFVKRLSIKIAYPFRENSEKDCNTNKKICRLPFRRIFYQNRDGNFSIK